VIYCTVAYLRKLRRTFRSWRAESSSITLRSGSVEQSFAYPGTYLLKFLSAIDT
jgi:hypothetical protein